MGSESKDDHYIPPPSALIDSFIHSFIHSFFHSFNTVHSDHLPCTSSELSAGATGMNED